MKKKFIIITILLITITLGVTYAWWRWNSTNNTNVTFTIDGITVTYEAGNDISGIKLIPVSTKEKGVTDNTAISKDITVSASKTLYFDLNMNLEVFNDGLQHQSLKWEIYTGNTLVNSGNFGSATQGDTIQLLHNREVGTTSTTYKLYIWIDGNQDNPTTMMNQNYKFVLGATATDERRSDLPDFIKNSNAPLDSVNSTYVTGYYESYTVSKEDKATIKNAFNVALSSFLTV